MAEQEVERLTLHSRPFTWLVVALVASVAGCTSSDDASRREFVNQFVQSMASGTYFHLQFLEPGHEERLREARARMTGKFEMVGWDRFFGGSGQYEYYLRFSNGASGVLYLTEKGRERRVILVVQEPGPKAQLPDSLRSQRSQAQRAAIRSRVPVQWNVENLTPGPFGNLDPGRSSRAA